MDLKSLQRRQGGVGGSDAAAVLGVPTAFKTQLAVYESKVVPITATEPEEYGPRFWGNQLEHAIGSVFWANHLSEKHVFLKPGTYRRPGVPLVASVDFGIFETGSPELISPVAALEVKTCDRSKAAEWGKTGDTKIPEQYWVQVQHYYMVIPSLERIDVAVLIGGNDYREYRIPKDEAFCKDLLAAELAWWERHVVPRVPPAATERDVQTLKRLYPGTDGAEVDIAAVAHWHQVKLDAMRSKDTCELVIEEAQARILEAMKDAAVGMLPAGMGRYQRKLVKRAGYTVEPTEYVELRHIKPRKAKADDGE